MQESCRVWSRFEGKRCDGSVVKLRIQDLPKDRYADGVEFWEKYFCQDESISKAAGMPLNPEALQESREMRAALHNYPDYHCVVCCEDVEDGVMGDIAGMSAMSLTVPDSNPFEDIKLKTKEMETMFLIFEELYKHYDPIKELKLSSIFDGRGIIVHPNYRKLGIASEFVKMRRLVCKELKVPATGAWMSSAGSQRAADKDNWETVCEVKYEELEEKFGVTFTDVPATCKLMIARIDI